MYSKIRKNVVLWAEAEKTGRKKQDMAEKNKDKTNVMRLLGQKKIPYKEYTYECDAALSGVEVAKSLCLSCVMPRSVSLPGLVESSPVNNF